MMEQVQNLVHKQKGECKKRRCGRAFILPVFGISIFILIPVIMSLGISFTEWNFLKGWGDQFNGLANYQKLFQDEWFLFQRKA